MKVRELKKINKYAIDHQFSLDYKDLLQFNHSDIATILACIDAGNQNVETIIDFINWELADPGWQDGFQCLEGIEDFDIRWYLIQQMVSAYLKEVADMIFRFFDGVELKLFHTVDEWKAYIENINETMEDRESQVLHNISLVLEKATDNKVNLIKEVMEYSQSEYLNSREINEYFSNETLEEHLESILSLLVEGYNIESVAKLFEHWDADLTHYEEGVSVEINQSYQNAIYYLKNSTRFNHLHDDLHDDYKLIDIFNEYSFKEFDNIINLLDAVEFHNDKELFKLCLEQPFQLDKSHIRDYLRTILAEKDNNNDYREALIYLWEQHVIVEQTYYLSPENVELVYRALGFVQGVDGLSMDMAKFIASIQNVKMIEGMLVIKENRDTRELLYQEFPKVIADMPLSENQVNHYGDWLAKLSKLPSDVCQKVINIINIPIIKNMDMEKQNEIKELVLNPENFGSLDYIYTKYKEKQEEFNRYHAIENPTTEDIPKQQPSYNPDVKLVTVLELLENGKDIDKVLEGFQADDEITPKTLIRTIL